VKTARPSPYRSKFEKRARLMPLKILNRALVFLG
jgi:hypothetical protein